MFLFQTLVRDCARKRLEGPMRFVASSLLDPAGEDGVIFRGDGMGTISAVRIGLGVGDKQLLEERGASGIAGDDGSGTGFRTNGGGVCGGVESNARAVCRGEGAVAGEAVLGEDRTDLVGVADRGIGFRRRGWWWCGWFRFAGCGQADDQEKTHPS